MKKFQKGFTLVELLVVIGILAILTAVVLVAVNPGRQLAQARDTQRRADVNTIISAITALNADPDATATLPAVSADCTTPDAIFADATGGAGEPDLSVVVPDYVAALPEDPQDATPLGDTGYTVCTDATGIRYTVCTTTVEVAAANICVTR